MIDEEKVKKSSKKSQGSKGVSFLVTYHPFFIWLSRIIKNSLNILYMNHEAKAVFPPGLMVFFRSARS